MRNRMLALVLGTALLAGCGQEPTAARSPQQARHDVEPLGVTISGPSTIQSGYTCQWTAVVSGGTPPYTYLWLGPSGDSFNQTYSGGAGTLYLEVHDVNAEEAITGKTIHSTGAWIGCGS